MEKQAEKKAKKTSTTATAFEDEEEIVLTVLVLQKGKIKFSCFDMNDAFNMVPIDKKIVYLNDFKTMIMRNLMTKKVAMRNLMTKKPVTRNLMTKKRTAMIMILLSQY
jgi:hypothetical protein